MFPRDIDHSNIGYTGENSERYAMERDWVDDRLDVAHQKRGDFKETFNMGKFTDKEFQQKLPPILTSHWTEIQQFQQKCHTVTMKVLTLFGLALNVIPSWTQTNSSYRMIISQNNIPRWTIRWDSYATRHLPNEIQLTLVTLVQEHILISEVSLYCYTSRYSLLSIGSKIQWAVFKFNPRIHGLMPLPFKIPSCLPFSKSLVWRARVNVADAMQFWTSQSLKSTTHRVQIPTRQRFSIAYFVQPDPETVFPQLHLKANR